MMQVILKLPAPPREASRAQTISACYLHAD
jgi:hypothetical protein